MRRLVIVLFWDKFLFVISFQFATECVMGKYKSLNNPWLYKETVIEQSNLSEQRKAAAKALFEDCMARNSTGPHRIFPYDLEMIPGRAIYQAIAALINGIFRIDPHLPTVQMRAVDCTSAALILNVSFVMKSCPYLR